MVCTRIGLLGIGVDFDSYRFCSPSEHIPGSIQEETTRFTPSFDKTRYVTNADGKGWLMVRHDLNVEGDMAGSTYPPLPQYLKLRLNKTKNGRDFFTILEGKLKNKTASVKLKDNNFSFLSEMHPVKENVNMVYDKKDRILTLNDVQYSVEMDEGNPIPNGTWKVEIPYEMHSIGAVYEDDTAYAQTWFRIASESFDGIEDRFLHPGSMSLGCVTVTDTVNWTAIYKILISARIDDRHVCEIKIK